MKLGIIIVAFNCLEYTKKTVDSIQSSHEYKTIIIDNYSTDGTKEWLSSKDDIISIINPETDSLSGCWNIGIKKAKDIGCDYYVILNNDIILAKTTIDNLVKKIEQGGYVMVTGVNDQTHIENPEKMMDESFQFDESEGYNEHPDFSCFIIGDEYLEKIGYFDENYHIAYFEDNDAHARIALANEIATSTLSAKYFHFGSKTVEVNKKDNERISNAFRKNKEYFAKKWGKYPVNETTEMREVYYSNPFNKKDRKITDTRVMFSINTI